MLSLFMSYMNHMLRLDDMGKDIGSFCFWACSSSLLVHPKRERPGEARVVTSYMGVVRGYVGSFGYDGTPRSDGGRRQVVTVHPAHLLMGLVKSTMFGYCVGVLAKM